MSKPIYLPHSARNKYDHCPRLYFLHYKERIRPVENNSTLFFGIAVDGAAEEYLKTRDKDKCRVKFTELWSSQEKDGVTTTIKGSAEITYSKNDLDLELIPESYHQSLVKDTSFKTLSDLVKDGRDKGRIADANWYSLYYKAKYMLAGFMEWVDHNVEEVLGTQVAIELEDAEGNKVPGLADFVIKLKGYDKPVLIDLKTSARFYERGSVKESEQLALYYFYLKQAKFPDMERAAYLVLNKQIKKNRKKTCLKCGHVTTGREQTCAEGGKGKSRCNGDFSIDISPEAVVQYIHDEIPEEFIQATIEKFNICVADIKAEKFEHNWKGCDSYYGRECPYKKYCQTGCMDGLVKKERKVDV